MELAQAFRELPNRDRELIVMRFFTDMTQMEIAHELGVSQMQVSRLLAQLLATLRQRLDTPRDRP